MRCLESGTPNGFRALMRIFANCPSPGNLANPSPHHVTMAERVDDPPSDRDR